MSKAQVSDRQDEADEVDLDDEGSLDQEAQASQAPTESGESETQPTGASSTDDEPVPGFVPLKKALNPIIMHEEVRAVELARPVLPGTNEERKTWAMRWFTARRLMFVFACGSLLLYFFLLINHLRMHGSYPVNFPDIDHRKAEIRALSGWINNLGNVRLRTSEAKDLGEHVEGYERLVDMAVAQYIAETPGVDEVPEGQRYKVMAKVVSLADVAEHFKDSSLTTQVQEMRPIIERVREADWSELHDPATGEPGPLRQQLDLIGSSFTNDVVAKLVKAEIGEAYDIRRTDDIEYIRDRDLELRFNYFSYTDRKEPGAWLLLLALAGFVGSARLRWQYNPTTRLPIPNPNKGNEQLREAVYARWGILGTIAITLAIYGAIMFSTDDHALDDVGKRYAALQEERARIAEERRLAALAAQKQRDAERRAKIDQLSKAVTPADFAAQPYQYRGGDAQPVAASYPAKDHEELWTADLPLAGYASPVAFKDVVVAAVAGKGNHGLVGFDAATGEERWSRVKPTVEDAEIYTDDMVGEAFYAAPTPVIDGARAFGVFGSGDVLCVEIATGGEVWSTNLGLPAIEWCHVQSPLLYDGKLIVPYIDAGERSGVFVFDPANGEELKHVAVPGHSWGTPVIARFDQGDQLVAYGAKVHGIDMKEWSIVWEGGATETGDWGASPVFTAGLAIVGMADHGMWAFDATGKEVWSTDKASVLPDYPSPVAAGEKLFVLKKNGTLSLLNANDGKVVASTSLDGDFWANPVLVGSRLIAAATDGTVYVVGADAKLSLLGTHKINGTVLTAPAVREGLAVFRTNRQLTAIKTGAPGTEADVEPMAVADAGAEEKTEEPVIEVSDDPFILEPPEGATPAAGTSLSSLTPGQWGSYRGPWSQGVVDRRHEDLLDSWDGASGDGIRWRADLPDAGISQPIVWNDRIYLTTATDTQRRVIALDRATGAEVWNQVIPAKAGKESPKVFKDKDMGEHYMHAAATPATDGVRVYAIFANGDLAALDAASGEPVWVRDLGLPANKWGHSQSLVVHFGKLIVPYDQRSADSACYAFDPATGAEVWSIERPRDAAYTSPVIVETRSGWQMYLFGKELRAYNPKTGGEIWHAGSFGRDVSPNPVFTQEKVYAGQRGQGMICVRIDGQGAVDESHIVWRTEPKAHPMPHYSTMVTDGRRVWAVGSKGEVSCFDVQTGEHRYTIEEIAETVYAAPVLIGDRVLVIDNAGRGWWIAASSSPALNPAGTIPGPVYTAPAVAEDAIFIRNKDALWCVGEKE